MTSPATAPTNPPRLPCSAPVTVFNVAAVSFANSIGPPGSENVIAMPATNGARLSRVHSSSLKSALPVIRNSSRWFENPGLPYPPPFASSEARSDSKPG